MNVADRVACFFLALASIGLAFALYALGRILGL